MKFINGFIFKTFFATIILQNALQLVLGQEVSSKSILSICGGGYHACAVFGDKAAKCWGLKLAFGESDSYVDNAGDVAIELKENLAIINPGSSSSFNGVDCGFWHTCLRLESKQLKCIGDNQYGQTGSGAETSLTGSKTGFSGDSLAPVNIGTGLEILAFTLGVSHTCIGVTGNRVKCFGLNDKGQLGYGDMNNRGTSTSHMGDYLGFVNLGTNVEVASLHTGPSANHNCIVIFKPTASSQRIKCWGSNEYYQLGYGDINHRGDALGEMGDNLLLVDLGTESRVKQLTLGSQHTCALLQNDGLKCWGTGSNGQLGSGSQTTISSTGNAIPFLITNTKATILFFNAGSNHLCVLENDYITLKCIGKNDKGQLGQGDTMNRGDKPTSTLDLVQKISFGTGATRISGFVSGSDFNCVVFEDSSVKCFGDNSHGQLAIGNTNNMGDGANEMGDKLPYAQLNKYSSDNTKDATNQPGLDPATSTTITIIIVIIIFCACCGAISKRCKRKQQFSSGPGVHVNVNVSSPASAHPQPMYPYMMPYHHPMMHHQSSKFEQPPPAPSTPKKKDIEKEVVMAIAVDSKDSGSIRGLQTGSSRNVQNDGTPTAKISNTTPLSGKKQFAFVSHVQSETGAVSANIYRELLNKLEEKGNQEQVVGIDNDYLTDYRGLSAKIKESGALVAILSKSYFSRPWSLIELYYALEYSIPIVAVNVVGSGYNNNSAAEFLRNLNETSLDEACNGASKELNKLGIDIKVLGQKLSEKIPALNLDDYNPNAAAKIQDAQFEVIFDNIEALLKSN